MTELIEDDTGLINQDTGLIDNNSGMLNENAGLIEDDTGLISETGTTQDIPKRRRKRSKERGKDIKPRNFPLHTMKNLPQFRNKSHDEVRQYILEKKGVDIGSNFKWNDTLMWILVATVIVVGGIGVWKLWQQRQERKNNEDILETNPINY